MLRRSMRIRVGVGAAVVVGAVTFFGTAAAQKAGVPHKQDCLAMGEENVKQLLLLMDAGKNGMVSKQDYMKFMEAEFERLDAAKRGELDARALNRTTVSAARFSGK